jgi:hypothetical protein|nr:MAG TPA: hypothetical protein [Caudoviricetes sp.]
MVDKAFFNTDEYHDIVEELRKKVDAYILRRELQPFEEIVEEENITEEILMVPIKKKKLEPLFTPIFEIKE